MRPVRTVLAEALADGRDPEDEMDAVAACLAALTAAGFAVVKLPEGVAVEHGARLVARHPGTLYVIHRPGDPDS